MNQNPLFQNSSFLQNSASNLINPSQFISQRSNLMSFDNELQVLLQSYHDAFSENNSKTRFIFPTYQYIGNTINTLSFNQTQQMLLDCPNYQYRWNECHKLNENPQTFATV